MKRDYALTEGKPGKLLAHRADCAEARLQADLGLPVFTMFGCAKPLPNDIPRHSCLKKE